MAMAITWPACALVLGLAFIVALWDGLRRYASARGIEARLTAHVEDQIKSQSIALDTMKVNAERLIGECAQEITAVKNGVGLRIARSG
jgi:hypothetical protein